MTAISVGSERPTRNTTQALREILLTIPHRRPLGWSVLRGGLAVVVRVLQIGWIVMQIAYQSMFP
jgi:hypothetical protein